MERKFIICLVLLAFFSVFTGAQNYYFEIPKYDVDVYIRKDASIDIYYEIVFKPVKGYHSIDIVDIGFPNEYYNLRSVKARINDREVAKSQIKKSSYIDIGVEIHLLSDEILPGNKGKLWVYGNNPNMVYQDRDKEDYASMEFIPTWFGSQYVSGMTDLKIKVHFPAGVTKDETIYHGLEFTNAYWDSDGSIVFLWEYPYATMTSDMYRVGVSFPKKYVDRIYKPTAWTYFKKFFMGLLGFLFNPCMIFIYIFVFIIVTSIISSRKRMKQYLPPSLKVEGVGIKRGLTAVEAAVLNEMPLNKVTSMIIYGLVKKKGVKILSYKPLKIEPLKFDYPWYDYEEEFFGAIDKNGLIDSKKLETLFINLIKKISKKLKGFNLELTRKYYNSIVNNAWQLVRKANIPELQSETINKNLEWLLMDEHFDDKLQNLPYQDVYLPSYWYNHIPHFGYGTSSGNMIQLPSTQFANDFVKGFQVMSDNVVNNVQSFFSKVTQTTNPPPKPSSGGGSSSSGGGCACACACAGCACACAGGGR